MKTYLLLDRRLIHPQGVRNALLRVAPLHKDTEHGVLFREEFFADPPKRWEVRYDNGYPNVLHDSRDGMYRCYYTLFYKDQDSASTSMEQRTRTHYRPSPERRVGLAYAESRDGIHWEKPELGLVEFEGSRNNNLLFLYAHGTGVMLDERDPDPARRYKLVTKMDFSVGKPGFMAVNFSPDGVHWGEMQPWSEHNPVADSHNFPFYDPNDGKYRVLTRCWRDGVRVVVSCESEDFLHWSAPREILRGCGFGNQVYAMPVFLRHGLYLGLAAVFHEEDRELPDFDTVDCRLYYAVTPDRFDVVAEKQNFIPRGTGCYPHGEFDCGCIYASPPVEIDGKLYFYYMGGNGRHTDYRETSLGRGWIEKDKFAYYTQRDSGHAGILTSTQLKLSGTEMTLLADTDEGGWVSACLQERWDGGSLEGFSEEDCRVERVAGSRLRLRFAKPLSELSGPVCLVLRFEGARIYAVEGEVELASPRLWEGV